MVSRSMAFMGVVFDTEHTGDMPPPRKDETKGLLVFSVHAIATACHYVRR